MRLQDEALQTVRPRDFYLIILVAVVLLGAMGIHLMETGRVPGSDPRIWLVILPVVWAVAIRNFLRYRPQPFPWGHAALLIGVTLQGWSDLMLPDTAFRSWVEHGAFLLITVGFATRIFHFGKADVPPEAPAGPDV